MDIYWWLACALVGGLAGFGAGLFGIGGGAIMVPTLILGFSIAGMPPQILLYMALATSLTTVVFTQCGSAFGHWRRGVVSLPLVFAMAPGMFLGGLLGAWIAYSLSVDFLQFALAIFLTLIAMYMLLERHPGARFAMPGRLPLLGVGGSIGTVSAIFGIGGGAFSVPFFNACGLTPVRASANAAACGLFLALGGSLGYVLLGINESELPPGSLGFVYLPVLICMVISGVLCTFLGVRLAHIARPRALKISFALVIFVAAWQDWLLSGAYMPDGGIYYSGIPAVAFSIGPVQIHWYGILYLLSFLLCWRLALVRSRAPGAPLSVQQVESLVFYTILGVIVGGRCGYVFFYGMENFLADPLWIFAIQKGGMSFHGGLIGVAVAVWLYARRHDIETGALINFVAPLVPIGLGLGRLGNFINQELWGRVSEVPWAIVFSRDPSALPRHPSQLYELFLEGFLLYWILHFYSARSRPPWAVAGLFCLAYGILRFGVEFLREPDAPLWLALSRGQILCVPMVLVGVFLLYKAYHHSGVGPLRRESN